MNAKEISDATLPAVTPADDDLMILYDVSEGTTGKAPISAIAPKVAENIDIATLVGDTSNLIEASALSNLRTAAGATQHDVNVAIDSVIPSNASASNKLVAKDDSNYKSGTVNFICNENSWNTVDITFDSPMPDTDYVVTLESGNTAYVHVQNVTFKTVNGFTVIVWNRDILTDNRGVINWQAFKIPH